MTYITCRLTAKNRDQLRNPMLGNRSWAAFTFLVKLLKRKVWDWYIWCYWLYARLVSPFWNRLTRVVPEKGLLNGCVGVCVCVCVCVCVLHSLQLGHMQVCTSVQTDNHASTPPLSWLSVWSEVQTCIWPSWCHCHSLSLASVKSRLVYLSAIGSPG